MNCYCTKSPLINYTNTSVINTVSTNPDDILTNKDGLIYDTKR